MGLLALWIEDGARQVAASAGPKSLIESYSRVESSAAKPQGGLVVPPMRLAGTFGAVFSAAVRSDEGSVVGAVILVVDVAPVMAFVVDPNGLGETGEVLVGMKHGDRIQLLSQPRLKSGLAEVAEKQFPSLSAAIAGQFASGRAIDYRGHDVLVAYRPVGEGYENWGLIAKMDADEAYAPLARLRSLFLVWGLSLLLLTLAVLILMLGLVALITRVRRMYQRAQTMGMTGR
jgi:hypothetical protein